MVIRVEQGKGRKDRRATSSGLSTTGSLRGSRMKCVVFDDVVALQRDPEKNRSVATV
jgi:hypothetical protein